MVSLRVAFSVFVCALLSGAMAVGGYSEGPVISEFLASNNSGLSDQFGFQEDWIEIHNPTASPVNLDGWYLTDSATLLTKWRFPAVSLPPSGYLVVFASDRNLRNPASPLHTNFKLSAGGEYLALVRPDGVTVAWDYAPQFPQQLTDVSYGVVPEPGSAVSLVGVDSPAEALVPASTEPAGWRLPGFVPGAGWTSGISGVGYDSSPGSGGAEILLVVNTIAGGLVTPGDQTVINHLTGVLGHGVSVIDDGAVSASSTVGMDLVMVSSSVTASTVNTKLRDVAVPLISWERGLDDDFEFSASGISLAGQTAVTITAAGASHPLGAGFSAGPLTISSQDVSLNLASNTGLAPGGVVIATGSDGNPAILVVDQGAQLSSGTPAPAVRIHAFWGDDGLTGLNANGLALFDSLVAHGLAGFVPGSPYSAMIGHDLESQMKGTGSSALVRFSFTPDSVGEFESLLLEMNGDDGYVAWLNGVEIARRNAPGPVSWDSVATAASDGLALEILNVSAHLDQLVANSPNILAIHGLNTSAGDDDFLVRPRLVGGTAIFARQEFFTSPTPGAANVTSALGILHDVEFSADRGYFSSPFSLTLSNPKPEAVIRYTLDGSEPTATTGLVYGGPISISTSSTVRAAAFLSGWTTRRPETRTYLHLPDIIQQPENIAGWPNPSISVAGDSRTHDYEMDPEIVNDPAYHDDLLAGMTSIPTVSLVVKQSDMWNASGGSGFYRSEDLKKPASVEYINPGNPAENVQADCSVEGHSHDRMKRSLRLSFSSSYGESKFDSTIFTGAPVVGHAGNKQVDDIVLRAGNNHSFARSWNPTTSTYFEDEWYRDSLIDMGNAGSPGRFVHLYINGIYWGLYNAVQRPDADFAAGALGGNKDDWFSVSHGGSHGGGSSARWDYLTGELTAKNMSEAGNYEELKDHVDITGFIDYVLCGWYAGLNDWPGNNWWGANRNDPAGPFHFFGWDGETAWGSGNGANLGAWVHPAFRISAGSTTAPAARIWQAARFNPDFLMLAADRAYKHLSPGGALETSRAVERWDDLANLVRDPIVAESARWGDVMQEPPSRRDIEWQDEVDRVRNVMLTGTGDGTGPDDNGEILISRMRSQGYYPSIDPPEMSQNGGAIPQDFDLTMVNPNPGGAIYFTLDGSDPRSPGGALSPSAQLYSGAVAIDYTLVVKARVLDSTTWSALNERLFVSAGSAPLRVTEIMYNPGDPTPGEISAGFTDNEQFEFLEFRNIGENGIDLTGAYFTKGITFTFGTRVLAPGGVIVLVKNAGAFEYRYGDGITVDGVYEGSLDNDGEQLRLRDAGGEILFDITYNDIWHPATDHGGWSLVIADIDGPLSALDGPAGWRPSAVAGGSPGVTDPDPLPVEIWRLARFNAAQLADEMIGGLTGDADGDGVVNVMEFVCGTDPWVPQSTAAAESGGVVVSRGVPAMIPGPGAGEWQVVFGRRKAEDLTGLTVVPRFCTVLGDWSGPAGSPVVLADDGEVEILSIPFPSEPPDSSRFFRLEVTLPAP